MTCTKCGAQISEDSRFCSYCGNRIEAFNEQKATTEEDIPPIPSDETTDMDEIDEIDEVDETDEPELDYQIRDEAPESLADRIKRKAVDIWDALSVFGKFATVTAAFFVLLFLIALLAQKTAAIVISVLQIALVVVAVLIHREIIVVEEKKIWLKWLLIGIAAVLTILNTTSYYWGANKNYAPSYSPASEVEYKSSPNNASNAPAESDDSASKDILALPVTVEAPYGAAECAGQDYMTVLDAFRSAGFTSIRTEKVENLQVSDEDKLNAVDVISVGEKTDFVKNQEFERDDNVLIRYHDYAKYNVNIYVDFIPNLIFSKYDVNLLLNGTEEGKLPHGNDSDFEFRLTPGEYTLTFESDESSLVKGKATLTVDCDIESAYKISCYSDEISVETLYVDRLTELAEGEVKLDVSASDYKNKNYEVVSSALSSLGFTNIKCEALYDIVFGWTDSGTVESVNIDGNVDFRRGDVFPADAEIVITYHMPEADDPSNIKMTKDSSSYSGLNYAEVEQEFKDMGFTDIELGKIESEGTSHVDGEVISVEIDDRSFSSGDFFKPDKKVYIKYYQVKEPITIDNNSDFAAILTSEYVDPEKQAAFISAYEGEIVEFDCVVFYLEQNAKYKTIYNYILAPGEDTDSIGASLFYLENMSMSNFKWDSATRPEYLTVGSKLRIQAEIISGDDPLYIYLRPVYTWGR